jgi:predicted aldo/keto reductase-like oxidoreductase
MSRPVARRSFIAGASATLALAACKKDSEPPAGPPAEAPREGAVGAPQGPAAASTMPHRPLGKTGMNVSIVGLGGFHVGTVKGEAETIRIIRTAIDSGVTFMDNCWDYNEGRSEERMGKALRDGYREKAFLMTKLDGRTKRAANEQLEQSLRRLQTDVIDLVQIHEVIRPNDPERCFAPGGCIEALVDAQRAGKLRFIGFTGHKDPEIHLAMLKAADDHHFVFDTVQLPLNVMDPHYRSFEKMVVPVLVQKGIGVLGMKSLGSSQILDSKAASATECLHYAMNLPTSTVITGIDSMGVLEQAIQAALTFAPMGPREVAALLDRTKPFALAGKYERFKTSTQYDGTHKHPEWLESASI